MIEKKKPFRITASYDVLLRGSEQMPFGLYHLHLVRMEQLCRLHYSRGSLKAVGKKLRALADHNYVQIDTIPTKLMRSYNHYLMGKKAWDHLKNLGLDLNKSFRASKEIPIDAKFIEHTIEINDVLISAALLQKTVPDYYLHDFTHERLLKQYPCSFTWQGKRYSVIPDGFLDFRKVLPEGGQIRMPVLLEHDMGTEYRLAFRERIRSYIGLLKTEAYKERLEVDTITVAFTTFKGEWRRDQMRKWTKEE